MQLSEKDKQALQQKYKAQRQAMWSGKQSTSQDSEEKTPKADQTAAVESASGETSEDTTDSTDARSSNPQTTANQPSSTEAPDEATTQSESNVQRKSGAEAGASASSTTQNIDHGEKASQSPAATETSVTPAESNSIAQYTEEQEEEEQASGEEQVFWEALEQEGGPSTLTWKLVLAVIGIAIVLIGVGVYLGFLFAS